VATRLLGRLVSPLQTAVAVPDGDGTSLQDKLFVLKNWPLIETTKTPTLSTQTETSFQGVHRQLLPFPENIAGKFCCAIY
jgi:hypothetical protein